MLGVGSLRRRVLTRSGVVIIWIALGLLIPYLMGHDPYRLGQLDYIISLVMVAVGLNIVLGFAGQLFLGPGALFAGGGYLAAILATHHTTMQSLPAMCLVSVAASLVIAAVAAIPTLRVGGF